MFDIPWTILLIIVAITDIRKRAIPDILVGVCLICGIFRLILEKGSGFGAGIAGVMVSTIVFFVLLLCVPGSFGGGDIKLSGAIGLYLGVRLWVRSFIIAVMTAGAYALYLVLVKGRERKEEIAFGPFLCMGAIVVTWYFDLHI